MSQQPTIELEHAIGFNGAVLQVLYQHPNGRDVIFASGGCIVVADPSDPHHQIFLNGHSDNVSCLAVSTTGRYLLSGQRGDASDAIVWDYDSKSLLYRWSEHDFGITAVAMSHDERLAVTCGNQRDQKLFIWDLSNGCIVASTSLQPCPAFATAFGGFVKDIKRRDTDKYLLATVGNKAIHVWDIDPALGHLTNVSVPLGHMQREFTCVQFSPCGELLFAGSKSSDFAVISLRSRTLVAGAQAVGSSGVHAIAALDADRVLVGAGDGSITLFQAQGIATQRQYVAQSRVSCAGGAVTSLSVLALGGGGGEQKAVQHSVLAGTRHSNLYRTTVSEIGQQRAPTLIAAAHANVINAVSYPPDTSEEFATASADGSVRVWNANDYTVTATGHAHDDNGRGAIPLCVTFPGGIVISGWSDGKIRGHDAQGGDFLWSIDNAHRGSVTCVTMTANKRVIISGGEEGEVRVWELKSRQLVSHLKEHSSAVNQIVVFADDVRILTCSRDKTFLSWDLRKEKRLTCHAQRMGGVNSIALSADQTRTLTVGQERKVTFWDIADQNPLQAIQLQDEALAIAVSHSGKLFVTAGSDQLVKLWHLETGTLLTDGLGHSGAIKSVAFSPDDRQLVSVGADGNIFIWNVYA